MQNKRNPKSGQAIIFLMVVVVIGLFVVIWNFDLHRVITAKIRTRNAADAAALAGARWQGITLNMIGDLNLIQAAILSEAYMDQLSLPLFEVPPQVPDLHNLRSRLAYIGPLAAFQIAQQAAFQNGAVRDAQVEANLIWLASTFREFHGGPYDNAFGDYADLLESIAARGAAVSSYTYNLPNHPLTQERFYSAIAQAMTGWWCPMKDYEYELENMLTYEDWTTLRLELEMYYMLGLKLGEYVSVSAFQPIPATSPPGTAIPEPEAFIEELDEYFHLDERGIFASGGYPDAAVGGMYRTIADNDIIWHVYGGAWDRRWPKPTTGKNDFEEDDEDRDRFPLRNPIQPWYNYMGAEAGIGISMPVHRGIVASAAQETVDLVHRAKAKPFGYFNATGGFEPPYYYGFVFPVFNEVHLIHSDIGDPMVDGDFFRHVLSHVPVYLAAGPSALASDCRYCQLLKAWEALDREKGLKWLDAADKADDKNPCSPEDEFWDDARGGATGGS